MYRGVSEGVNCGWPGQETKMRSSFFVFSFFSLQIVAKRLTPEKSKIERRKVTRKKSKQTNKGLQQQIKRNVQYITADHCTDSTG